MYLLLTFSIADASGVCFAKADGYFEIPQNAMVSAVPHRNVEVNQPRPSA